MLHDIIALLQENARLGAADIAQRLGVDAAAVEAAIAKAEADGAIRGYRVITADPLRPEVVQAVVEVGLEPERDRGFDRIAERIARFPEVKDCVLMSGGYDLSVTVHGKGLHDVASFVSERLATIDGVRSTRTHFVLKRYKQEGVLLFGDGEPDRLPVTP